MRQYVTEIKENPEYSVTQISNILKRNIEDNFSNIKIRGEISGLKIAPSGHVYLSLKDNDSVISAVIWRGNYQNLKVKLEDGMEVVCFGNITIFAGQSKYQLIVSSISLAGVGALMALLEKRKKEFAALGYFDQAKKKNLPKFPTKIGVVTSITGAVIKDILHRIQDRYPCQVLIWSVLVQGDKSAQEVATAIDGFNQIHDKPDLLIVARGGGSIEDLWSFNEEIVIKAAYNSSIPIISAIGHETDITLLDFVADRRAPTPTAAAEIAVPVRSDLLIAVREFSRRLRLLLRSYLDRKQDEYNALYRSMPKLFNIIENKTQKLDDFYFRMKNLISMIFERRGAKLNHLQLRLRSPLEIIKFKEANLGMLLLNFSNIYKNYISKVMYRFQLCNSLLDTLSYKNTLNRGYAIIRQKGMIISEKSKIENNDFTIEFKDGVFKVEK